MQIAGSCPERCEKCPEVCDKIFMPHGRHLCRAHGIPATATMAHLCHANGCRVAVPPKMFMCRRHWFMLPKSTRDRVWVAYRSGQEITKDPSEEYMDVAAGAIAWLDAIEHDRLDVP